MRKILVANGKGGCGKTTLATTLASALAPRASVALADADRQRTALAWAKVRSDTMPPILALDWSKEKTIGDAPKSCDVLVIDGPGGLRAGLAEQLVAECEDIVIPVLPSPFDWRATERFINKIAGLKRVRKGKTGIHLVANRMRPRTPLQSELEGFLADLGYPVLARISDRMIYPQLAAKGESVFDHHTRDTEAARKQWQPLVLAVES